MSTEQIPETSPLEAPQKGSRRRKIMTVGLTLLCAFGVVGCILYFYFSTHESTDDATLIGHVHPVSAKIDGTVANVYVKDNQWVNAGQLLLILDPKDYVLKVEEAKAALETAKIQEEKALNLLHYTQEKAVAEKTQAAGGIVASLSDIQISKAQVSQAEAGVIASREKLAEAQTNLKNADIELHRFNKVDPRAVSKQQFDTAKTNDDVTRSAQNAAQAELVEAEAHLVQMQKQIKNSNGKSTQSRGVMQNADAQQQQIKISQNDYDATKASVLSAQVALDIALTNLSYTQIKAPESGRIGNKSVEVGQRIQTGQMLMATVSPDIWVVANFKETQLRKMRPGQKVDIRVDAYSNHPFYGKVDSFSPASGAQFAILPPENATGNFTKIVQRVPVKILLDPKSTKGYENLLVPGMSTVVTVHVTPQ
jgi:membrane fusion protein, multidrug efflux system